MAHAVQHANISRKTLARRQYQSAQSPARGLAVGLTLSTILWLIALVAWLHFGR
ncbi:hypothetical protein SAMN05216566_13030 [Aureimonas phyllosphaerae]|uniref:Uncharacterized protein n=1 Tax=Aureimonas phyllosphaerae TaxID=1166078 RepID=A0A7W6C2K7_9HYPH|nr:hypothetical protein [Aureimonas phyllosphaerae]MBB3962374.1 hypothetical protein [Aureimonas phyllosphaerae]SFF56702.1 hypothetical protein SAMN05216566_13030 [Aureimonas phyllosphaerae]